MDSLTTPLVADIPPAAMEAETDAPVVTEKEVRKSGLGPVPLLTWIGTFQFIGDILAERASFLFERKSFDGPVKVMIAIGNHVITDVIPSDSFAFQFQAGSRKVSCILQRVILENETPVFLKFACDNLRIILSGQKGSCGSAAGLCTYNYRNGEIAGDQVEGGILTWNLSTKHEIETPEDDWVLDSGVCMKAGGGTVQKVIKLGEVLTAQSNLTEKYVVLNAELHAGKVPKGVCCACSIPSTGRVDRRNATDPYFRRNNHLGPDYRLV